MTDRKLAPFFLAMTLAGCGGSSPPPAPPATAAPAPSASARAGGAQTDAQVTVGHFRSPDGMVGLVLDRTAKPKLKVDGQNDIVELTQKEDRDRGTLRGYILEAPDGTHPITITRDGRVRYHRGHDDFDMMFDKNAEPLGAASVTGTFTPAKPGYQALGEKLAAMSIRKKLPQLEAKDAAFPAKVGEAIDKADASMVVHYVTHGATSWLPHFTVVPRNINGIGYGGVGHTSDEKWEPAKAKGLAKYGGKVLGFFDPEYSFNHTNVVKLNGYPPPLAEATPGLIWEVDDTRAVFVAFDGGRYEIDLTSSEKGPSLELGAGPKTGWPTTVQHPLLDIESVSQLSRAGALPPKATSDLEATDTAWNDCTVKAWKEGPQKLLDAHKGPGPRFSTAEHREAVAKVKDACKKHVDAEEKLFLQLVEERLKARQALLDKAKAKF